MRLASFEIRATGPIELVRVDALSNVIVFAGPNGVGKTSINNALLALAQKPAPRADTWMLVEATNDDERARWKKSVLDTRNQQDANILSVHLRRNQRRNRYHGSFLNFDSDRAIRNVQSYGFSWDVGDPYAEDVPWQTGFQPLQNRYNEVRHSLFRLVESQRREIANRAIKMQLGGETQMALDFPDVLKPFKDAFWQLLAPKRLAEVNIQQQQIFYEIDGQKLNLDTLSSGEKEVVNIVFDFLLRSPEHCVVIFDEPELHLHPELSFKLLQTLAAAGSRNQFVFSTHSPEIISASLENTVVFVSPRRGKEYNQAIVVHRDDETHNALQALGQSIGVISLGKKLILIEGEEASLDKQTYGAILRSRFPEFVLVPAGGKDSIRSFDQIRESILDRTIWGVEFFLLCDRDAANSLGPVAIAKVEKQRIELLPRYHIENYFLDETVLASVFAEMVPADSWLRNPQQINGRLRQIAREAVPYAAALNTSALVRERVGNVSLMAAGVHAAKDAEALAKLMVDRAASEAGRVTENLTPETITKWVSEEHQRLSIAVESDTDVWKRDLPGRLILNRFAATAPLQVGMLKQLYLAKADKSVVFAEIFGIFERFRQAGTDAARK